MKRTLFALVVCVSLVVCSAFAQEAPRTISITLNDKMTLKDVVEMIAKATHHSISFDNADDPELNKSWVGDLEVVSLEETFRNILEPHGLEAVPGWVLHIRKIGGTQTSPPAPPQTPAYPYQMQQVAQTAAPVWDPSRSLAARVVSDSVKLTGPTWLDVDAQREAQWVAATAAYNTYQYNPAYGYGRVLPSIYGGGYGYGYYFDRCVVDPQNRDCVFGDLKVDGQTRNYLVSALRRILGIGNGEKFLEEIDVYFDEDGKIFHGAPASKIHSLFDSGLRLKAWRRDCESCGDHTIKIVHNARGLLLYADLVRIRSTWDNKGHPNWLRVDHDRFRNAPFRTEVTAQVDKKTAEEVFRPQPPPAAPQPPKQ